MAVIINAKGTSNPHFRIGKQGTTLFQGSADPTNSHTVSAGDVWFDTNANTLKFRNSGDSAWEQGSIDITGNATISGNLTINGTTTILDTTNITVEDPLMLLSSGASGSPSADAGFVIERGSSTNVGIIWDESADEFAVINTTEAGTTAGNVSIASYAGLHVGSFIANGLTYPTSDGTNGQVLQTDGQGALSFADGGSGSSTGLASVQTFTSSGTWTRPSGITKVIMEVQGAGGGGGNSLSSADNNVHGAGGGYCKKFLDVSSISTSTITIGSGGTGTAYNVSAAGTDGGASSWADGTNTITGGGGDGGDISPSYVVSVGGTATGGDINIAGQSALVNAMSYAGDSVLGFGGLFRSNTSAAGTQDGKGYGGGGTTWSGYATGGCGNGSGGIVIVWEYK